MSDVRLGALLTEQDAIFDRRQVIRAVAETATQGPDYDTICRRVAHYLDSDAVVDVAACFGTPPEMLALEADALRRSIDGPRTAPVDPRSLVLAAHRPASSP